MPRKVKTERDTLVSRTAIILTSGDPTHFAYEGPLRHVMRSSLCATGWRWQQADDYAAHILVHAFLTLNARRPNWEDGQPLPISDGANYRLCKNCGEAMEKSKRKFCSDQCKWAHFARGRRLMDSEGFNAKRRLAYSLRRLPEKPCEKCGRMFEPIASSGREPTRFCSTVCRNQSNGKKGTRPT
jgi:endogenous inhibitor of DNA gyrase (YacG/DUF329 family)